MTEHIDELINGYLDGTLSAEQLTELSRWIESDPANADQFAEAILLDGRIHAEVNAAPYMDSTSVSARSDSHRSRNRILWVTSAVVAAALLIGVGISFWNSDSGTEQLATETRNIETDVEIASIAQTLDAEWENDAGFSIGDRLSKQVIELRSGFASLTFVNGVEVTLQGPARLELLGSATTRLTQGVLTANVPPGAEGFTVDTPTAEVVDLGTSFGIDLRDDGYSSVSVFDGEVEVAARDASERHLLTEGQSVRIGADQIIEQVDFEPERFERVWPVSSGIVGSSETFRFVPPWPKQIRFIHSDDDIFVAAEGHSVDLFSSLGVNISESGDYSRVDQLTPLTLPAGKRIRSYILHYMPESQRGLRRAERISGSITFDRPVVGLIVQHEQLFASSRRFSRRPAGEAQHRRQLNLTGGPDGDRITLSEDRRTVTVDLISPGRSSDLVRIIVDSSADFRRARRRRRR